MKIQVFLGIVLRIMALFITGMLLTYVPDLLRGFFGDTINTSGNCGQKGLLIDCEWDWGARHYWYSWMMVCLFIASIINIIVGIVDLIDKHYPS